MNDHDQDSAAGDANRTASESPIPPRGRGGRLALRIGLIVILVVAVVIALGPMLVSGTVLTSKLEGALRESLATHVTVESASIGWFDGLTIDGLRIANPEGFPQQDCVTIRSLRGDVALTTLLGGRIDLAGRLTGLDVHVFQRQDGSTNLESLGRPSDSAAAADDDATSALDNLRLDLELEGGTVVIEHESHGIVETVRNVTASVAKEFGTADMKLILGADLGAVEQPARLDLNADVDATFERPLVAELACRDIDLARYRALVDARYPGQFETLSGRLDGDLTMTSQPGGDTRVDGELTIDEPHLAGEIVGGLDVTAPSWSFSPKISTAGGAVDTSELTLDLGFLTARGLTGERTEALCGGSGFGAAFDIDLAQLVAFGVALPDGLETDGMRYRGEFAMQLPEGDTEVSIESLVRAVGLRAELAVGHLGYLGRVLDGLKLDTQLRDGVLTMANDEGATFDGGALRLTARADLTSLEVVPTEATFDLKGAKVGGSAIHGLRFVIPLLAGIAPDQAHVDFDSGVDLDLTISGPGIRSDGQDVLTWLDAWRGQGKVGLSQCSFTPAPQLAEILQLTGQRSRLTFDAVATEFAIDAGTIASDAIRFDDKERSLKLQGTTTTRGDLAYTLDIASMLQGRKDGDKILKYVGAEALKATLGGTLTSPQLGLPDLGTLLQTAAQKALEQEAKKHADRALRDLFDRLKR